MCSTGNTDKLGVRQYLGIILKPHKMFQGSQTIVLVKTGLQRVDKRYVKENDHDNDGGGNQGQRCHHFLSFF